MENQINTPIADKEIKSNFWTRWIEKYHEFVDSILFLLSVCLSIVIIVEYGHKIKDLDWPLNSDRILLFITLFSIVSSILFAFKNLIVILIGLITIYWMFFIVMGMIKEWNSVQPARQNSNPTLIQNIQMVFTDYEKNQKAIDSARFEIQSLKAQLDSLKCQMDSSSNSVKSTK